MIARVKIALGRAPPSPAGHRTGFLLDADVRDPADARGAPTDARPFFFNTLKPGSFRKAHDVPRDGVVWGNVRATWTLVLLFAIAAVLIICIIVWPLARSGLPTMEAASFVMSIAYFAIIGVGYLLIQVPFL
jgi:hypothetical protein